MSKSCPTCHHLHANGRRCGSPALRGQQFCFYHHPTRRPPARTPAHTPFDLPPICYPEDLQIALSEIIRRVADNTLDSKRASLLLFSLQLAKANLAALPAYPREDACAPQAAPASPDFPDLSGLLAELGLHPTLSAPGH